MIENEKQLVEAIAEMREEEAFALAKAMLDRGEDPARVLELCRARWRESACAAGAQTLSVRSPD
jgi:hypothetical protein